MSFDAIFSGIARAKPVTSYLPKPGQGTHQMILKKFQAKNSDSGQGTILETEFAVLQSTTLSPGEQKGWPFYVDAKGFGGQYQQASAKEFIEAIMNSVDLTTLPNPNPQTGQHDVQTIGAHLVAGNLRGVVVVMDVRPAMKKGVQISNEKGQPVNNAFWKPLKQTWQEVVNNRTYLDQLESGAVQVTQTQAAPAPAPAPAPVAFNPAAVAQPVTPGVPGTAPLSILNTLRKG